MGNSSRILKN
jgi:hypothetical protein